MHITPGRPLLVVAASFLLGFGPCSSSSSSEGSAAADSGIPGDRCSGPNAKTIANRYFCLPEGARCAGQTLPCCTDECESNDGNVFNPDDNSSLYLTCDTKADRCKLQSEAEKNRCAPARATTLFQCPDGSLQCGYYGDPGQCCPPSAPYNCPGTDRCFSDAYSADEYCRTTKFLPCITCIDTADPPVADAGPTSGDPCAPCAPYTSKMLSACTPPNELSFNCYCTTAKMQKCVLDTPGCSTDKAESQAEVNRMVEAANATGDGTCRP